MLSGEGGEGGENFHKASDMDVLQIRIRFLTLKSAKGVIFKLLSLRVPNFRKIKFFSFQLTQFLRNFFKNAKKCS